MFSANLFGNFRQRPVVRPSQAIQGDAWVNRNPAGIHTGAPPPAQKGGKGLRAAIPPIELRGQIIHPSLPQPPHGIGIDLVELIQAGLDLRRLAFGVNTEGADSEEGPGALAFHDLVGAPHEGVDVLAPPIAEAQSAAATPIGRVGVGIGEADSFAFGRVGVKVIIIMQAIERITAKQIPGHAEYVLLHCGRARVHPEQLADLFGMFWEAAAGVIGRAGILGVDGRAVGIEPSMDFQAPAVAFLEEDLQRIEAWGDALGPGEEATPRLELGRVESTAFRAHLDENVIEPGRAGHIEQLDDLPFLFRRRETGLGGIIEVPDRGDPDPAELLGGRGEGKQSGEGEQDREGTQTKREVHGMAIARMSRRGKRDLVKSRSCRVACPRLGWSACDMLKEPWKKYRPFPVVQLPDRQWPNRVIERAPIWCSVDLRDGNQALPCPMTVGQKLEFFQTLVEVGFKEIEVGFPAASNTEFAFIRRLIEEDRIPEDVTIQVLVQAREELIERTVESLRGARRVIIHLYNSTSPAQRRIVFGQEKPEIVEIARRGTRAVQSRLGKLPGTEVIFQYSPESFSATEVEFSLEICRAVMEIWQPTPERKMILNLPDTVEVAMPNVYADQIEWFIRNLPQREAAIISVHTHNDRNTGTAATELAMLAGAERVEGTLFGNGERTGNLDIVTVALNLYCQGISPGLDFSNLAEIRAVYERCTEMRVPERQPYAGELVFTAFSGSHQDAIKKGFAAMARAGEGAIWDVPYLILDPGDIGREYREVIRVNSQSGKGGVAYLLEAEFGISLPRALQVEFGAVANEHVDRLAREVSARELRDLFWAEYVELQSPYRLEHFHSDGVDGRIACRVSLWKNEKEMRITGQGNGPLAALVDALVQSGEEPFEVSFYSEHSLGSGSDASAIAYIQIRHSLWGDWFGAATDTSIELASVKALLHALNRAHTRSRPAAPNG